MRPESRQQVFDRLARPQQLCTLVGRPLQRATPELDRGHQLRRSRHPHPGDAAELVDARPRQPVDAAERGEHRPREVQGAGVARAVTEHDRDELVIGERRGPEAAQLLARPVGRRQVHVSRILRASGPGVSAFPFRLAVYSPAMLRLRVQRRACFLVCLLLVAACFEPPTRELNQAQGAIDAARAAGAADFATTELQAAEQALKRAHEAATVRDYRQALSLALDAKERARDAARSSADRMALLKSEAELVMQSATQAVAQARGRLATPEYARVPAARLARRKSALTAAEATVQEARAAADRRDYVKARAGAEAALAQVREALAPDQAADARPAKGSRPASRP